MKRRFGIAAAAVVSASLGAGGASTLHAAPFPAKHKTSMATKTVKIVNDSAGFGFNPKKLTVKVGTKVVWKNTTQAPHTITGTGSWKFASKTFSDGQSVHFIFKKAGTYHYMCSIHKFMKGMVVVKK